MNDCDIAIQFIFESHTAFHANSGSKTGQWGLPFSTATFLILLS
jgi:hypothetical protein